MKPLHSLLGLLLLLFFCPITVSADYQAFPDEILYRLYNKQSMYEYIKGSGEETWGDLVFNGTAFYGAYTKDNGNLQSTLLFCTFADSGLLATAPVELSDPDQKMWGPRLAWTGAQFGLAYSTMYKGKFRLVSTAGVATAPVELPKMIYLPVNPLASPALVQVAALKPVWTGNGFLVFGLVLEPADNPPAAQYYSHLCVWRLDPQGNVVSSREIKNIYGMTYEKYRGMEHGWYNVCWSGGRVFLAYLAWDNLLPTTLYQMLDMNGDTVVAERRAYTVEKTVMVPMIAWSGTSFALTGYYQDLQSSLSDYYIRFFDGAGTPLGAEQLYNTGEQTYFVHNAVSWLGDKFVAAFPTYYTIPFYTTQAVIRLAFFNAAGQRLAANSTLISIGDNNLDFNWFTLGSQLKLVGDGDRTMVQGRFYHLLEQRFTPLIYRAVGDVVTPAPPLLWYPATAMTLPGNSVVPFQWSPVAKNNQYRFQLAGDNTFTNILVDRTLTGDPGTSVDLGQVVLPAGAAALGGDVVASAAAATPLYWRVKGANTGYSPTATFSVAPTTYQLAVTMGGSGGGSVNSDPSGIACTKGECQAPFTAGTDVILTALGDKNSVIGAWNGACTGCSGKTCTVTMTGPLSCGITFTFVKPARIGAAEYDSLQAAYDGATDGAEILAREYLFTNGFTSNAPKKVTIRGGYDQTFTLRTGFSTIGGGMVVGKGAVVTDGLQVR